MPILSSPSRNDSINDTLKLFNAQVEVGRPGHTRTLQRAEFDLPLGLILCRPLVCHQRRASLLAGANRLTDRT